METQRVCKGLLALVLVAGQAMAEERRPPPSGKEMKLAVQVDVVPHGTGSRRPVMPGEVLSTGDKLALRAEAARGSYVFVLHESATSGIDVLVPTTERSGGLALSAGVQTSLLPNGALLELDVAKGKERLYVVAAPRPLTGEEAKAYGRRASLSLLDKQPATKRSAADGPPSEIGLRGEPPPPPPPPPPHPIGSSERQPPCDARVHLVWPVPGEREPVTVACFCVEHGDEPREAPAVSSLQKRGRSGRL